MERKNDRWRKWKNSGRNRANHQLRNLPKRNVKGSLKKCKITPRDSIKSVTLGFMVRIKYLKRSIMAAMIMRTRMKRVKKMLSSSGTSIHRCIWVRT